MKIWKHCTVAAIVAIITLVGLISCEFVDFNPHRYFSGLF